MTMTLTWRVDCRGDDVREGSCTTWNKVDLGWLVSAGPGWAMPGTAQRAWASSIWVVEFGLGLPEFMGERADQRERGMREEEKEREGEGEGESEEERERKKRNFGFSDFQNPNKYPFRIFKTSFHFDVFFIVILILNEYDTKSNFQVII